MSVYIRVSDLDPSGSDLSFGVTANEAVRAYLEGKIDALSHWNPWRSFVEDHAAGAHPAGDGRLAGLCPVCSRSVYPHSAA